MAKKERIGILSGRYDPVCSAHIRAALSVLESGSADRVLLILSGLSGAAPAEDRWKMLVAAAARDKRLIPSRLCLDKNLDHASGAAMKALSKLYPDADLFLLPSDPVSSSVPAAQDLDIPVREYCQCKGLYGFSGRLEQIDSWMDLLFDALKPRRFAHSLSVARTSALLAGMYGENPLKAEQAGLLHDCAKCLPLKNMQHIAVENRLTDDPSVLSSDALLHSIAGACLAEKEYGMADPEVLEAIRYHNTGYPGMSRLAMCVCLADFMEPLRESFPLLENVRTLSRTSLEKALLLSLEGTVDYVKSRGWYLYPRTLDTITWLRQVVA